MARRSFLVFALLLLFALPLAAATFQSDDGVTLHYDVVGKGSPVVLLAGGPGFSPEYLRPLAERLGKKHSFILFHQRGTGRSVVETYDAKTLAIKNLVADLDALRRELKVEKLTLVGHSFGGILSMFYAVEHPDRIRALALVDSGGPTLLTVPKFVMNLNSRFTVEDNEKIREWSDAGRMKENRSRAILEITKAKTGAYFADRSKAHLLTDPMTEESFRDGMFYAVTGQLMSGFDLRGGLAKVKFPVLVIHGKQDPLESAQEVHDSIPGSRLEMIDDAGHFPWLEQPEKVYGVLGKFLAANAR
jgi:proline iminopeptidase